MVSRLVCHKIPTPPYGRPVSNPEPLSTGEPPQDLELPSIQLSFSYVCLESQCSCMHIIRCVEHNSCNSLRDELYPLQLKVVILIDCSAIILITYCMLRLYAICVFRQY